MASPDRAQKRTADVNPAESNGKGKVQKLTGDYTEELAPKICVGAAVFRLLCPASRISCIIQGKDGNLLSEIMEATGADISVEDIVPGCEEQVVVIQDIEKMDEDVHVEEAKGTEAGCEEAKGTVAGCEEALGSDAGCEEALGSDAGCEEAKGSEACCEEAKGSEAGCEEAKGSEAGCEEAKGTEASSEEAKGTEASSEEAKATEASSEEVKATEAGGDIHQDKKSDSESIKDTPSSAQKALILFFDRVISDGVNVETEDSSAVLLKLLVPITQVGCILGKGDCIIKQMASDSGAQIQILPRDKLPLCASVSNDLVLISGDVDAVRKGLQAVSQQLLDNLSRDQEAFASNPGGQSCVDPLLNSEAYGVLNQGASPCDVADLPSSQLTKNSEYTRTTPAQETLTFRLLCPEEKIGGVIGKGGTIVKTLKHDTGCDIKILDAVPSSEERIIIISGQEHPDDRISPAQDALLRVQAKIIMAFPDTKDKNVTARLLVYSHQIGCLLGKGGAVITDMRKSTGAYIRIMGKDHIPNCASEGDEVVQIIGEFEVVKEALLQITTRLRQHFFRDPFPSIRNPSNPGFLEPGPPFPSYMGRRGLSSSERFSNRGPSFDSVGGPRHGNFYPHDTYNSHRPGMPPYISERQSWAPQGLHRGSQPAFVTNTTMDVVVPSSVVPAIYGEDGACLKQILEISEAKIRIIEPQPGAAETMIVISGAPDEAYAAQSLIQAFVLSEMESTG